MSAGASAAKPANPLAGLYDFVRGHLLIANNVVVASGTLVAVLDFCSPRMSMAPRIVYSATAAILGLMLLAGLAPRLVGRLISAAGLGAVESGAIPLWRRPAWQFGVAILFGVSILGWASVAKAGQGGLIASQFPQARSLQESLLSLRTDVAGVARGVDAANGKLDALISDARDPQREAVAMGYAWTDSGLASAIQRGDLRAVKLFSAAGFAVHGRGPVEALIGGRTPPSSELAAALQRSLIQGSDACAAGSDFLFGEWSDGLADRVAAFKRLCDAAPVVAALERQVAVDAKAAAPSDYQARTARGRSLALALLKG